MSFLTFALVLTVLKSLVNLPFTAQSWVIAGLYVKSWFRFHATTEELSLHNKQILYKHKTGLAFLFSNQTINRLKVNSIVKQNWAPVGVHHFGQLRKKPSLENKWTWEYLTVLKKRIADSFPFLLLNSYRTDQIRGKMYVGENKQVRAYKTFQSTSSLVKINTLNYVMQ